MKGRKEKWFSAVTAPPPLPPPQPPPYFTLTGRFSSMCPLANESHAALCSRRVLIAALQDQATAGSC